MIAWDTLGLEFSGEAEDGEAALAEILDIKLDIVITDLRMPFIDGLGIGEAVAKEMRNIKFIFISGIGRADAYLRRCCNVLRSGNYNENYRRIGSKAELWLILVALR